MIAQIPRCDLGKPLCGQMSATNRGRRKELTSFSCEIMQDTLTGRRVKSPAKKLGPLPRPYTVPDPDASQELARLQSSEPSPRYETSDRAPPLEAPVTQALRMGELEIISAFAASKGLTVAELEEAADIYASAKAEQARAEAKPRPDWIEAHKKGIQVPEFIEDKFAAELANGAMHLGFLSRYTNLRRDLYAYKRHHELPDWLAAIPTQAAWTDRQIAEGKVKPRRPLRDHAARAYDSQRAKSYRATKLAAARL